MKAYVFKSDMVRPFGLAASDCLVLNKTIAGHQRDILGKMGIKTVFPGCDMQEWPFDSHEHLCIAGNCFFTSGLMQEFLRRSRRLERATRCYMEEGVTTQRTGARVQKLEPSLHGYGYGIYYFPAGSAACGNTPVTIDPDRLSAHIPVPEHMCAGGRYLIPMTDKFVIHIESWMNLWVANIVALIGIGARLQNMPAWKKLWLAAKARSFDKWKILRNMNRIGKNCDIHPAAYIEGSRLGSNVAVGAGSVVRFSDLGDNVYIGSGVVVENSCIGGNSSVLSGHILFSVAGPGFFSVADMVTASMIGRNGFLGHQSILLDCRMDNENVCVLQDGQKIDSGNLLLGGCLGNDVRIGAGVVLAPGRVVESNSVVTWDGVIRNPRNAPGFSIRGQN